MALQTHNEVSVPPFMYGTAWKKQATARPVELAVTAGFKAIDTANQLIHYEEALVGEALQALAKKGIRRDTLFLQTKFTPAGGQDHRTPYDPRADLKTQVQQSFDSSLTHLHTDYLDSYVLHAPLSRRGLGEGDWEIWAAMEELYRSGKTRTIGISNVSPGQLSQLCEGAAVNPMMVQNRCFAALGWDRAVRDICRQNNIIYQGFSLLTANTEFLAAPAIQGICRRLGAGPTSVIFAFAMQAGMLPLTGTTSESHMHDDLRAQNLVLSVDEIQRIESIAL